MPDHQIRLRGPWQITVDRANSSGEQREASVDIARTPEALAELLPAGFVGRVRLERVFHRPTGLGQLSRVLLHIESNVEGEVTVNRQSLGALSAGANRFDITRILAATNRIQLDVRIDARRAMRQPEWEARLEIFDGAAET